MSTVAFFLCFRHKVCRCRKGMVIGMEICLKQTKRKYIQYLLFCLFAVLFCACGKAEMEQQESVTPTVIMTPTVMPILSLTEQPAATPVLLPTELPNATPTLSPTELPTATPVVTDPYDGRFWTGRFAEDKAVLMTKEEIQEQNGKNYRASGTKLVKLGEVTKYSVAEVIAMIEDYSLPSRKYYDNREISSSDKEALLQARNLSALRARASQDIEPEYGILVENTNLRSFPSDKRLTSQVQGRFDYLQETRLLITEPVLVLHRSPDGAWCFVQAENYCGWIKDTAIAYCTKEELCAVAAAMADVEGEQIAIVTKNGKFRIGEQEVYFRMGTRLLRSDANQCDEESVTFRLPYREENSSLAWETVSVKRIDADGELCFTIGYLPYTRANVIRLAVRLLDAPYAWGDAPSFGADAAEVGDNGMDCSSTVSAIFRCFGFVLPRNTGTQRKMECEKQELSALGTKERQEVLDSLQGGELLYTSGHVMLYLGQADGVDYVLHNTSTEARDDGGTDAFYRCVITTMGLGKTGQTIKERLIQMNALFPID